MADVIETNGRNDDNSGWAKTLATIAIFLALAAGVVSFAAHNRASEALDKANQQLNSTNDDGSDQEGLMRGTDQAPVIPPTQETEDK